MLAKVAKVLKLLIFADVGHIIWCWVLYTGAAAGTMGLWTLELKIAVGSWGRREISLTLVAGGTHEGLLNSWPSEY